MTVNELINRFSTQYKDYSEYDIENLRKWVARENLNDSQLEDLYEYVSAQYEYNTFPKLGKIIKIWQNTADVKRDVFKYNGFQIAAIDRGRSMSLQDISDHIRDICNMSEPKNTDVDFIDVWESLSTAWGLLIERGLEPARANAYGKKLHAAICGGSRIDVQRIVNSFFPAPIMPVDEEKLGSVFQKVPEAE